MLISSTTSSPSSSSSSRLSSLRYGNFERGLSRSDSVNQSVAASPAATLPCTPAASLSWAAWMRACGLQRASESVCSVAWEAREKEEPHDAWRAGLRRRRRRQARSDPLLNVACEGMSGRNHYRHCHHHHRRALSRLLLFLLYYHHHQPATPATSRPTPLNTYYSFCLSVSAWSLPLHMLLLHLLALCLMPFLILLLHLVPLLIFPLHSESTVPSHLSSLPSTTLPFPHHPCLSHSHIYTFP